MRERTRWVLMAVVGATALLAGATLLALRFGRPLYYSDGERVHFGAGGELRAAPMLLWGRPEPEAELVGEVRGRVATLPDGGVVYGRALGEGRTELVHAPRAGAEPVPIVALLSAGHDLSPTLAPDGQTLFFASDRAHASGGGYDVWQARYDGRGFYPPTPVAGAVATAGDEVDPVLDPRTGELVFARRAVGEAWFRLWTVPLDASRAPEPLWPEAGGAATASEREPALAPDGGTLWFVRHAGDGPIALVQSFRHVGRFLAPTTVASLAQAGTLRAPEVLDDGRSLRLLDATRGLVYRARAREVHPWWEGQRVLEQTLLVLLLVSLLVLALLILGRRWRALDVVTWCLIASVLLHVAILLWLRGVEIVRRYQSPDPRPGQMEVTLVAAGARAEASAAPTGTLASEVAFASQAEALQVAGPDSAMAEADRATPRAAEAERAARDATAPPLSVEARVQDEPVLAEARAARAAVSKLTPAQDVAVSAQAARVEVAPTATPAADRVVVELPSVAARAFTVGSLRDAPDGERGEVAPLAGPRAPAQVEPADAPDAVAQHAGVAAAAPPIADVQVELAPRVPALEVARAAQPAADEAQPVTPAPSSGVRLARAHVAPVGLGVLQAPAAKLPRQVARTLADEPQVSMARGATGPSGGLASPASGLVAIAEPALAPRADAPLAVRASAEPKGSDVPPPRPPDASLMAVAAGRGVAGAREAHARARPRPVPVPTLVDALPPPSSLPVASPTASALVAPTLTPGPAAAVGPTSNVVDALPRGAPGDLPDVGNVALPTSELGVVGAASAAAGAPASTRPSARQRASPRLPVVDAATRTRNAPSPARAPATSMLQAARGSPLVAAAAVIQVPARRGEVGRRAHELTQGLALPPSALPIPPTDWMAVAGVGARAVPEFYGNRFGPQKAAALEMFGGTPETEAAVRRGLEYLARIQQRDGGFGRRRREHEKYGEVQVGKSALCLLAFLGAGHTPGSDTVFAPNAAAVVAWLLAEQDSDTGHFGDTSSYSHGITTYALAECYAMTKDARLRAPLERAVAWIVKHQNRTRDRRSFGGWPYFSGSRQPEDRFARTSITAWMVMALESARMSGLAVADGVLEDARTFLWGMFDTGTDTFLYNKEPSRLASAWRTLPGSTPAAVFCLLLTGADREDPRLRAALAWTLERAPGPYRRHRDDDFVLRGAGNVYFWYYGTLACFLAGGEVWPAWNSALKDSLLAGQDVDGSFPPIDVYAEYAGDTDRDRAYTTAMCVLSLEAYYRYLTPLVKPR